MAEQNTPACDPIDAALLDQIQQAIPLVRRPFGELGRRVAVSEDEVIARLRAMRGERKLIRQVSAIFDTHALGYGSGLVAGRYSGEKLDDAAAVISGHPGVSHCYQRDAMYNLWYTVAVPPNSTLGYQGTIDRLHELSGAACTRAMPTLKLYKIGVRLNVTGDQPAQDEDSGGAAFTDKDRAVSVQHGLTEADIAMVRVLQQDMPIVAEPWAVWADQAGCTVAELLEACERFGRRRQMRRFAAVLHHREAGFKANVMGVWKAPDDQADRYGQMLAAFQAVSHCYLRPSYDDWPYNLYTMVHARSRQEAIAILDTMARQTGLENRLALWSVKEYKKVRVVYFDDATAKWESQYG